MSITDNQWRMVKAAAEDILRERWESEGRPNEYMDEDLIETLALAMARGLERYLNRVG